MNNEKIKNLAVVILPANISEEEVKQVFSAVLDNLVAESNTMLNTREGFVSILNYADLHKSCMESPNPRLITLVENILHEFGDKIHDPLVFSTAFVCEYYGPRDLINHEVITLLAQIKENSVDWNYLKYRGLEFLVPQCRNILSNQR